MAHDLFRIVGTTVAGAFRVEAVVAEGGFAVVYRAHHAGFRAPVALKCLKIPQYLSAEERARFEGQFQAEAELLFKLSASIPAVVRPLHVEAIVAPDGSFMPFLALEWLDGETLDAFAKRRGAAGLPPFSLDELISLLAPVARALDRAHHFAGPDGPMSIVHRDMKPENLFVARVAGETVIKILDFGIAKAKSIASQVAGRASQSGGSGPTSFTPAYGAPEQWLPKRFGQTGPWTDVWGMALTMVELLVGRPVIDGDHAAMMGTVLDPQRRPTPRTEGVDVGSGVEAVFRRALAVDPRERYGDVGELWSELLAAHAAQSRSSRGPPGRAHAPIPDLDLRRAEHAGVTAPPEQPFFPSEADLPTEAASPSEAPRVERPVRLPSVGSRSPSADSPAVSALRAVPLDYSGFSAVESRSATFVGHLRRFGPPAVLVALGTVLSIVDGAYAGAHGEVFTLGPLRLAWLVALLVLSGIGLALYRVFGPRGG